MYANLIKAPRGRRRRTYSGAFKAQVVTACLQPGVSIAGVALANGLNANLLRRWVKESPEQKPRVDGPGDDGDLGSPPPPTLVPVAVSSPEVEPTGDIKIEIHRSQAVFEITWPVSQAASCAQWLRDLLR
jgi:transposase-like protein